VAKTYNSIPSVATGDVYTAAAHNAIATNVNNYRVPPHCHVYRSSNLTSYSSGTDISWNAEHEDTDGMFSATSTNITIQTEGVYLIILKGRLSGSATISATEWLIRIGGTVAANNYTTSIASAITSWGSASYVTTLAASSVVTGAVVISGGSAYEVRGGASPNSKDVTSLSVTWLGQAS